MTNSASQTDAAYERDMAYEDAIETYTDEVLADESMWRDKLSQAFTVGEGDDVLNDMAEFLASRADWPACWRKWAKDEAKARYRGAMARAGEDVERWGKSDVEGVR